MTAYYLEGNNIAWLNGVCLFLIVIGFLCTLTKFIIPKNFSANEYRLYLGFWRYDSFGCDRHGCHFYQ
jgi:hypothetical protein